MRNMWLMADGGQDDPFRPRQGGLQHVEIRPCDDPVFIPLDQEDLAAYLAQARTQVQIGQQLDTVRRDLIGVRPFSSR